MLIDPKGECNREKRKLPSTEIVHGVADLTVGDFWSWAYSDLFSNTVRPLFAEFIVGKALGVIERPRMEWTPYDFVYGGKRIEVKSSGYLQSEPQNRLSTITFDIENRKQEWDMMASRYRDKTTRSADCYVFCLHSEADEAIANILDLAQWEFCVMSTDEIEGRFGSQKSVALSRIRSAVRAVPYSLLKENVDSVLGSDQAAGTPL
jgi:hypothetical protein